MRTPVRKIATVLSAALGCVLVAAAGSIEQMLASGSIDEAIRTLSGRMMQLRSICFRARTIPSNNGITR